MSGPTGTSRGRDELVDADPRLTKATVDLIARLGPSDRETLTSLLGVGRSTLARAVGALLDARIVVEVGTPPRGRGRPRSLLAVSPSAGSAIGLDFGLRHVRGAIVDGAHNTVATAEVGLAQDYSVAEALGAARSLIGETAVASSGPIVGVGLALPGPVDRGSMALTRSSILPGWANVPILQEFSAEIPYPVVADNESNLAAYAESFWGAATDVESMLYLKLHSGVGGAIVSKGQVERGQHGAAGEFGHLSWNQRGVRCRCGNRGCLEALIGIPRLVASMSAQHDRAPSYGEAVELVRRGDPACQEVIDQAGRRAGRALATLCNALDPEAIVIGGSLLAVGATLLDAMREGFVRAVLPMHRDLELRVASLGRYASALGATGLVLASGFDDLRARRH